MSFAHLTTLAELYTTRSSYYDDSWHPAFALHILNTALSATNGALPPTPILLDLACGTGLVSIPAVQLLPNDARIFGVDISRGMLSEARKKLSDLTPEEQARITLIEHDMVHLRQVPALEKLEGKVDIITCASAFVLLPDAEQRETALSEWRRMLRPGTGVLVFDVTHEHNLRSGIVMEYVAERFGLKAPSDRKWSYGRDAVSELMSKIGGFEIERIELKEQAGEGLKKWSPSREAAEESFDALVSNKAYESFGAAGENVLAQAREYFVELWAEAQGDDGMVDDVDGVYVIVARRKGSM